MFKSQIHEGEGVWGEREGEFAPLLPLLLLSFPAFACSQGKVLVSTTTTTKRLHQPLDSPYKPLVVVGVGGGGRGVCACLLQHLHEFHSEKDANRSSDPLLTTAAAAAAAAAATWEVYK